VVFRTYISGAPLMDFAVWPRLPKGALL
jgi:hypothetical protein